MKRNKSFANTPFYFVATPIGNLKEFSSRAVEILNAVDFICVEDTRTSGLLLSHFNIKKPLISVHKFNEKSKIDYVISKIINGEHGAFISDAGYPLISDPGSPLVNALLNANISVSVINGPSAILPALIGSGLSTETFTFVGFLKGNAKDLTATLNRYKSYRDTLIFYEAPHRINKTISTIYSVFAERKLVIARELTKLHEEFIYTSLSEFSQNPITDLKGEIVLVVEGYSDDTSLDTSLLLDKIDLLIKEQKYSVKEATQVVAILFNVSKNILYDAYIKRQ